MWIQKHILIVPALIFLFYVFLRYQKKLSMVFLIIFYFFLSSRETEKELQECLNVNKEILLLAFSKEHSRRREANSSILFLFLLL